MVEGYFLQIVVLFSCHLHQFYCSFFSLLEFGSDSVLLWGNTRSAKHQVTKRQQKKTDSDVIQETYIPVELFIGTFKMVKNGINGDLKFI